MEFGSVEDLRLHKITADTNDISVVVRVRGLKDEINTWGISILFGWVEI